MYTARNSHHSVTYFADLTAEGDEKAIRSLWELKRNPKWLEVQERIIPPSPPASDSVHSSPPHIAYEPIDLEGQTKHLVVTHRRSSRTIHDVNAIVAPDNENCLKKREIVDITDSDEGGESALFNDWQCTLSHKLAARRSVFAPSKIRQTRGTARMQCNSEARMQCHSESSVHSSADRAAREPRRRSAKKVKLALFSSNSTSDSSDDISLIPALSAGLQFSACDQSQSNPKGDLRL